MDSLATYRQIIQTLLIEYAGIPDTYDNTQNHTIFDVYQDRYLLVNMGCQGKRHIHDCVIHIEIIEGQVWIQQNNTDQRIGEELVKAGIPREHIVLGFQPLELRPYSKFSIGV